MDAAVSAPLRAIVVDDEPLARRGLEIRLAVHADVQIVGYYGDGASAIGGLRTCGDSLMVPRDSPRLSTRRGWPST